MRKQEKFDMLEGYPDILKVPEVSKILRIGTQKVYKLLRNGEIKNRKKGKNKIS